ncbi:arginine N-methyltransferase 2 [Lecanosticta acicola]|uniref:Arginine N-methyltransferase 2 n=1 Tax=Lecanosticta acicola TaxID=111012 RepID=A0AAI8Z642_9PEZI|nr:arginine N-methyltransferase 2 [Lecanosticta acicola]
MTSAIDDPAMAVDTDTTNDEILLAATNHDNEALQLLLRKGSARIQDPETGFSPLHAAIASCEPDKDLADERVNGEGDAVHGNALDEDAALSTVQLLFENGAIWNELDNNDETPGCIALRLGLRKIYDAIVSAGVRAELLFGRLDEYEPLPDDGEDEDEHDEAIIGFEPSPSNANGITPATNGVANAAPLEGFEPSPNPSYKVETSAAAQQGVDSSVPVVVQTDESGELSSAEAGLSNPNVNSEDYLRSKLTYSEGRLLDSDKNAVMMDWETEIMKASADQLCPRKGLRTMNIGHGMGIVDRMFLENEPEMHHIIEAHPEVMQHMRETGWYDKPNVTVHEGRWQDVLPRLVEQGVVLDGVYYDTYAEDYKDLKELFTEYVIALLDSKGKFGFYNGLGADRQICYDVYTKVVELDLFDAGLDVEWTTLTVPDLAKSWDGIRRPYWVVPEYRLPTCKFVG